MISIRLKKLDDIPQLVNLLKALFSIKNLKLNPHIVNRIDLSILLIKLNSHQRITLYGY